GGGSYGGPPRESRGYGRESPRGGSRRGDPYGGGSRGSTDRYGRRRYSSSTYRGSRTNIRLLNPQSTTHSLIRKHIHSSLQHISQMNRTNNTYLCSSSVFVPATGALSRPVHCSAQLCSSHVRRPNTPFVHLSNSRSMSPMMPRGGGGRPRTPPSRSRSRSPIAKSPRQDNRYIKY
ncbi:unnamed protein product, partial [Oppiella nova]